MNENINEFLKENRKKKKISAKEIGDKLGYSQGHISGIENGTKKIPNNKFIIDYLNIIATDKDELLKLLNDLKINKNYSNNSEFIIPYSSSLNRNLTSWIDVDGNIQTHYFDFDNNDLAYHLKDKLNKKYYKGIELNEDDLIYLDSEIQKYLFNKYSNIYDAILSTKNKDDDEIALRLVSLRNTLNTLKSYKDGD